MIELDIFDEPFSSLILAEVEFCSENAANAFLPPSWLGEDVTYDSRYHNSTLSGFGKFPSVKQHRVPENLAPGTVRFTAKNIVQSIQ